jgi:hypothetical protein
MEFRGMNMRSSAFVCCFLSDCKDIVACIYRNAEYCFESESHPLRVSFVQALSGHTACLETIVPFHNKKLAADVRGRRTGVWDAYSGDGISCSAIDDVCERVWFWIRDGGLVRRATEELRRVSCVLLLAQTREEGEAV